MIKYNVILSKKFITTSSLKDVMSRIPADSKYVNIHYDKNVKGVSIAFTKALSDALERRGVRASYTAYNDKILDKVMGDLVF